MFHRGNNEHVIFLYDTDKGAYNQEEEFFNGDKTTDAYKIYNGEVNCKAFRALEE